MVQLKQLKHLSRIAVIGRQQGPQTARSTERRVRCTTTEITHAKKPPHPIPATTLIEQKGQPNVGPASSATHKDYPADARVSANLEIDLPLGSLHGTR